MLHCVFRRVSSLQCVQNIANCEFVTSAEAEVHACTSGAADSLLLARLLIWLSGKKTKIHLYTDSSGARGILQRKGVGRLRHLSCRILWFQNLFGMGIIKLSAVSGNTNPADIGTKRLTANRLRPLMSLLGLFNMSTNTVESLDAPGRIFSRRQGVRTLISALGLLLLQASSWRLVSILALGFLILFHFVLMTFTCRCKSFTASDIPVFTCHSCIHVWSSNRNSFYVILRRFLSTENRQNDFITNNSI